MTATLTEPMADDLADVESNSDRRAELRRAIAQVKMGESRCEQIREALAAEEQRKEDLASAHVGRCQPWQAELAKLDKKVIDRILAKQPHDERLEERRTELLQSIRDANAELQADIDEQDRILKELQREFRQTAPKTNVALLEMELLQLAPAEMRYRVRVAGWMQERARNYLDQVRANPDQWSPGLHKAAVEAAEADVARAQAAADEAYRAAVNF